jgi:hypothetical protein
MGVCMPYMGTKRDYTEADFCPGLSTTHRPDLPEHAGVLDDSICRQGFWNAYVVVSDRTQTSFARARTAVDRR